MKYVIRKTFALAFVNMFFLFSIMRQFFLDAESRLPVQICAQKTVGDHLKTPVLLASAEDWKRVHRMLTGSARMRAIHSKVMEAARNLLNQAAQPLKPDSCGRKRMLTPARRVLANVLLLGTARHLSGDPVFSMRAAAEVEQAVQCPDWNPGVFLNTAELAFGVALALNWLGQDIPESTKERWESALINLALKPSLGEAEGELWWLAADNNWAQVCHSGLAAAAVVCAHRCPALADFILCRAIASQTAALEKYDPDGVYPEGPTYWSYGTHYTIILSDLLERNYGFKFRLDQFSGFLKSARFVKHATSPDNKSFFAFGDAHGDVFYMPALHWFANRCSDRFLDNNQLPLLENLLASPQLAKPEKMQETRFWPLGLLWMSLSKPESALPVLPPPKCWVGMGEVPVASMRTSWNDPHAAWVAMKGGGCPVNHAHMDAGSFVYASHGVLWLVDPGMQQYESLENLGLDIWPRVEGSQRWRVFRLGPEGHNIIRFEGAPQKADALCEELALEHHEGGWTASINLSPAYKGQASSVQRAVHMDAEGNLEIEDSWVSNAKEVSIQWLTFAEVTVGHSDFHLHQGGQSVHVSLQSNRPIEIIVRKTESLCRSYDAPNPGLSRLEIRASNSDSSRNYIKSQFRTLEKTDK